MQAKLKNIMTGDIVNVYATTASPDSSYGLECWVDDDRNSYGQCQFGAPLGFELLETTENPKYYAVVQHTYSVFGVGLTEEKAIEEAKEWTGDPKALETELKRNWYEANDGDLVLLECSKDLYEAVKEDGGNVVYEFDHDTKTLILSDD